MDDWDARQEARRRRLPVVGTLRVLADSAAAGLNDLEVDFERLRRTNFRVRAELLRAVLEEHHRNTTR